VTLRRLFVSTPFSASHSFFATARQGNRFISAIEVGFLREFVTDNHHTTTPLRTHFHLYLMRTLFLFHVIPGLFNLLRGKEGMTVIFLFFVITSHTLRPSVYFCVSFSTPSCVIFICLSIIFHSITLHTFFTIPCYLYRHSVLASHFMSSHPSCLQDALRPCWNRRGCWARFGPWCLGDEMGRIARYEIHVVDSWRTGSTIPHLTNLVPDPLLYLNDSDPRNRLVCSACLFASYNNIYPEVIPSTFDCKAVDKHLHTLKCRSPWPFPQRRRRRAGLARIITTKLPSSKRPASSMIHQ
jgi:hypothetical protein